MNRDLTRFFEEDFGSIGDITTNSLFTDETGKGMIIAKEDCMAVGLEEAYQVFEKLGATVTANVDDGSQVSKEDVVLRVNGPIQAILKGERLALNFISQMSGIATETYRLVEQCRKINPEVQVAATRKTTPGFRKYEKKAVLLAGGIPHRFGLFDMALIKDNHIAAMGSLEDAIKTVKKQVSDKPVEVEVETIGKAVASAKIGVDIIMLDNMTPKKGAQAAKKIRDINPDIKVEVSGGITPENITEYAPFADRISLGYLTHSPTSCDFSLKLDKS